jgi:O-methyltransferase involved in polyketide biosynthesis
VAESRQPVKVDASIAHSARVYDYWLGGKDNFAVDREAARQVIDAFPGVIPGVRAQRAFLGRAVRYLVGELGIRQFLDIGTGLPAAGNTHEVAQQTAADCRIVYVDNDPMVLTHARALLTSTSEGDCAYIDADLRDTEKILAEARTTLDFGQPVALVLLGIMQFIGDRDQPHAIVERLKASLVPGSYLVLGQPASDIQVAAISEASARLSRQVSGPVEARTQAEVQSFFDGLEMVEPGVVELPQWRPDLGGPPITVVPFWCGVGRKP